MHVQDGVALRGTSLCTSLQLVSFSIFQLSEFSVLFRHFLHHIFSFSSRFFFWLNCFIRHVRKFSNDQQCNLGRGSAASLLLLLLLLLLLTPWVTVSVTDSCCCCCCCCSLLSKAGEVVLLLSLSSPSLPSSPSFLPFIPSFFLFCPAQPRRQFDKRIFAGSTKWTCISYCMSMCVCQCVCCLCDLHWFVAIRCVIDLFFPA